MVGSRPSWFANGVPLADQLYSVTHRADYHETLHEEAIRLGCTVRLGCEMQDVDFEAPAVILSDGSVIAADVVVGADGKFSLYLVRLCGNN